MNVIVSTNNSTIVWLDAYSSGLDLVVKFESYTVEDFIGLIAIHSPFVEYDLLIVELHSSLRKELVIKKYLMTFTFIRSK